MVEFQSTAGLQYVVLCTFKESHSKAEQNLKMEDIGPKQDYKIIVIIWK